jgi:hypothetical protein
MADKLIRTKLPALFGKHTLHGIAGGANKDKRLSASPLHRSTYMHRDVQQHSLLCPTGRHL